MTSLHWEVRQYHIEDPLKNLYHVKDSIPSKAAIHLCKRDSYDGIYWNRSNHSKYPGDCCAHKNNDKYTYKGLNLHIPPNQDVLIEGSIGSGKSSLVKLLTNLQGINGGDILINGKNIKELDTDDIRNNILYVPQHPQSRRPTIQNSRTRRTWRANLHAYQHYLGGS